MNANKSANEKERLASLTTPPLETLEDLLHNRILVFIDNMLAYSRSLSYTIVLVYTHSIHSIHCLLKATLGKAILIGCLNAE